MILASSSPRRRELFALLGLPYTVVTSRYEEPASPSERVPLAAFVTQLATGKAQEVAGRIDSGWVLGADTEVALEEGEFGTPLGKPNDSEDARRMLRLLSGRVHVVITGVAVIRVPESGRAEPPVSSSVRTRVRFRKLSDSMITDYIATGEPLDKAGAYGAQGYAAPFIESFEGDFFNVVGLPLCEVGKLLERCGLAWWRFRRNLPPLPA
jgi:septum formation protein